MTLSPEDRSLLGAVANASLSQVPLPGGLRALATETSRPRLQRRLHHLADALDRGTPLSECWPRATNKDRYVLGVLELGQQTQRLGSVLSEFLADDNRLYHQRRALRTALYYPAVLLALGCVVLGVFAFVLGPELATVLRIDGFIETPPLDALSWWGRWGWPTVAAVGGGLLLFAGLLRIGLGAARFRGLLGELPVIGPLLIWPGLLEFTRHWLLLLRLGKPQPEALRAAAQATSNPHVAAAGRSLADTVATGQPLSQALPHVPTLPASWRELVCWGDRHQRLPEALELAGEMLDGRLALKTEWLRTVLPPIVLMVIATVIITTASAVLQTLQRAISYLSTFGGPPRSETFSTLPLAGFCLLGFSLIWVAGLVTRRRGKRSSVPVAVNLAGWVLVWFGLVGVLATTLAGWLILIPGTVILALMVTQRYRQNEARQLVWLLQTTTRKGLPLVPAVRAFADERHDDLGRRVETLASYLAAGLSLSDALTKSRVGLSASARLVANLNEGQLDLRPLDSGAGREEQSMQAEWAAATGQLTFALASVCILLGALTFVMLQIVPTINQIVLDFDLSGGRVWSFAIMAAEQSARGAVFLPLVMLPLAAALLMMLWHWLGWSMAEPPVVRHITARYHGALVLRSLAQYLHSGVPVTYALAQLAGKYPVNYIRQRLYRANQQIGQGQPLWEALRNQRLIGKTEAAVLQAAERAGNLEWAAWEMAERNFRQMSLQLRLMTRCGFPVLLVAIAVPTALLAIGLFETISRFIDILA